MKYTIFTLLCAVLLLSASCRGQEDAPEMPEARIETTEQPQEDDMKTCTFPDFPNVTVTGLDLDSLNEEEKTVLYAQARYCEAMTEADIDTLLLLTDEGKTYTHMSGLTQSREEYFADIADGSLTYYSIGMENPIVSVEGDRAEVTYTAALTANAYGAKGTFRMKGTHMYLQFVRFFPPHKTNSIFTCEMPSSRNSSDVTRKPSRA